MDITPRKGGGPGWYLTTSATGGYAIWYDAGVDIVDMVVGKDSWRPADATARLKRGGTLSKDFALVKPSCRRPITAQGMTCDRMN